MNFAFACSRCKTQISADADKAGEEIKCPNTDCNTINVIPALNLKPSTPPPPKTPEERVAVLKDFRSKCNGVATSYDIDKRNLAQALVLVLDIVTELLEPTAPSEPQGERYVPGEGRITRPRNK